MKRRVELGKISRPHGFKGGVVVVGHGGTDSALGYLKQLFIGTSPDGAKAYNVLDAAWMPKGWKLLLEGVLTDTQAKELCGKLIYADRDDLRATEQGEFYVTDLVGLRVIDVDTNREIGILSGVESGESGASDRWWVKSPEGLFAVPATKRYINKVDVELHLIGLQNLRELRESDDEPDGP